MATYLDIKQDVTTRDLSFDDEGNLEFVEDVYAIKQRIENALNTHVGEWPFDITFGLPYRQQILIKNPNMSLVVTAFISTIANTPGIIRIKSYDFDYREDERMIYAVIRAITLWGEIELEITDGGIVAINLLSTLSSTVPIYYGA